MNIPKFVACFILSAVVWYVFGGFVSNCWDVTQWTKDSRFLAAMITIASTAFLTLFDDYV